VTLNGGPKLTEAAAEADAKKTLEARREATLETACGLFCVWNAL
jgi:hypothetical protein